MTEWNDSELQSPEHPGEPPRVSEHAAQAAKPKRRQYGLPVARLGVMVWPNGDVTLYAKSEHGDEYVVESFDDVPDFIARMYHGVDLTAWANGEGTITLYDDGSVVRTPVRRPTNRKRGSK